LIRRIPETKDRRRVIVKLTPEGIKKREEAKTAVLAFNKVIRKKLGSEKVDTFMKTIAEMNQLFSGGGISGKDLV
jgi:MarR family transcriptional regulator, organic hydroperoxide resistance regulator